MVGRVEGGSDVVGHGPRNLWGCVFKLWYIRHA
ncbi:hypothetical protein EHYA_09768 [Embleya hyalina]|uniref:Uncharacterized protein n=1 Tax=Embleya hyalina TaxID=516124 RepID=A0A401Z577_9ACTN|nr:hypothetical protein EHYA_09768 [Embleya hyalina]